MMRSVLIYPFLLLTACHSRPAYPPGGYAYPEHFSGKDTNYYFCGIREKVSRRDSIENAMVYYTYRAMDEPNLSIKPMPYDVLRLTYETALGCRPTIITLMRDRIVVKSGCMTDAVAFFPDSSHLSAVEKRLLHLLNANYPLDRKDPRVSPWKQRLLDSMGRVYPQLYDPAFYLSLVEKEYAGIKPLFTYTKKEIKITPVDFDHLVKIINASGYWSMPPAIPCENPPVDGWGIVLEANTPSRYNFVSEATCDPDTSHFKKACQELVHYAKLDSTIQLVTDMSKPRFFVDSTTQFPDVHEPTPAKRKHIKKPPPNSNK